MRAIKTRVSISKKAEAVLLEVQQLTNSESLSGAAETLISLSSEFILDQLRAIKTSSGGSVAQQSHPMVAPIAPPPIKPRRLAPERVEF